MTISAPPRGQRSSIVPIMLGGHVVDCGARILFFRTPRQSGASIATGRGGILYVIFVCTGNICRSPTAERLALAYSQKLGLKEFRAASAGTRAVTAHPMHRDAATVLENMGGQSSNFAARQLTPKIVSDADLVLTMTTAHRTAVLERAPRLMRRTYTLAEASALVSQLGARTIDDLSERRPQLAAAGLVDVADPIGRNFDVFEAVGAQIANLLLPVFELIAHSEEAAASGTPSPKGLSQ